MPNCSWYWLVGISCWLLNSTLKMTLATADSSSESCTIHWNNCDLISSYLVLFCESLWLWNAINLISFQNGARPSSIKSTLSGIKLHAKNWISDSFSQEPFKGSSKAELLPLFLYHFLSALNVKMQNKIKRRRPKNKSPFEKRRAVL